MARKSERPRSRNRPPAATEADGGDLVFKAIANRDRRTILDALRDGRKSTGALCSALPHLDRCTVMMHLKTLEDAELVIARRDGRFKWNYLNVVPIQTIYRRWIKSYAAPAAGFLHRLKTDLER